MGDGGGVPRVLLIQGYRFVLQRRGGQSWEPKDQHARPVTVPERAGGGGVGGVGWRQRPQSFGPWDPVM